jgi:hypothetical protein
MATVRGYYASVCSIQESHAGSETNGLKKGGESKKGQSRTGLLNRLSDNNKRGTREANGHDRRVASRRQKGRNGLDAGGEIQRMTKADREDKRRGTEYSNKRGEMEMSRRVRGRL